ncbi:MAG: NUDIX hydrolase [Parasporobacterium sp.]|nr:NUDIX hydrolase [Parasporobacterium sp.]
MEYWDIYDADKQLTGRIMKREDWNMKPGEYHLTVLGVIRRPNQTFLITQRVLTKSWAPGWWEVSGGGVQAGETSQEAVRRELLEETGIDVKGAEGGLLFTYRRDNPQEKDNYFVDVYRFDLDVREEDVKIQEEEACGFAFATEEEIRKLGEQGIFLHYESIKKVFG